MGVSADLKAGQEPSSRPAPLGERMLVDAVQRALRRGRLHETFALVLHLSRLHRPAPLAHHQRIARAILQDVAQQRDGQVFPMTNGDLVLMCRQVAGDGAEQSQANLTDQLSRLFRLDADTPAGLMEACSDESGSHTLLNYAIGRLAEAEANPPPADPRPGPPAAVEAVSDLLATSRIDDLLQRQVGVLLRRVPSAAGLLVRPLYQELTVSGEALAARCQPLGSGDIDPFLFRHLAHVLDRRMLERLLSETDPTSPLRVRSTAAIYAVHLNLTVATILGSAFDRFVERTIGAALGAEVALIDACADPAAFFAARHKLAGLGITLILDGVSDLALQLAQPWVFEADLVKIVWSPRLCTAEAVEHERMAEALDRLDPRRTILQRAESEAAVRWGLAHGIHRFQGRQIDAMLGASRLGACGLADRCTLRQCVERAASVARAGRAGCGNHALLDAGVADELAVPAD